MVLSCLFVETKVNSKSMRSSGKANDRSSCCCVTVSQTQTKTSCLTFSDEGMEKRKLQVYWSNLGEANVKLQNEKSKGPSGEVAYCGEETG